MNLYGIVAFCRNRGISNKTQIPWYITDDIKFFRKTTSSHVVVMGFNTYKSIPSMPLKNRKNIVITSKTNEHFSSEMDITFVSIEKIEDYLWKNHQNDTVFICGGEKLYTYFMNKMKKIFVTYIDKTFECDTFFPEISESYELMKYEKHFDTHEKCTYWFFEYEHTNHLNSTDRTYTNLIHRVLTNKNDIRKDRTGTNTISKFSDQISFDIHKYIPVLTTKKIPWQSCIKELLWFLNGDSNANTLKNQGVHIWDGNSSKSFQEKVGLSHLQEGDCGANYSFQWRHFGQTYVNCDTVYEKYTNSDQIQNILHLLKTDPYSRRIFLSAWNPCDLNKTVLPPCHVSAQFYVGTDNTLSCHMYQRSCDVFLGLPWNIMSYAVLTHILGKKCGYAPKELTISFGDVHIYTNHLEQVYTQLKRTYLSQPMIIVNDNVNSKSIEDITVNDFELIGYFPHNAIRAEMSV
jgi:thymidylate synthase